MERSAPLIKEKKKITIKINQEDEDEKYFKENF